VRGRTEVFVIVIIDFHVHMAVESQGMWTPHVWRLLREYYPDECGDIHRYEREPALFRDHLEVRGIRKCVLLAEDSNETGLVPNDYILEYSAEEPDFFIPFCAINPNKTESFQKNPSRFNKNVSMCCEQLEWLAAKGCKGVKDYGSYNHIPFGTELMFSFYEKAVELRLPVLFHTGVSIFDSEKSKPFADPEGLGILADHFPDLDIIIGHCGSGMYFKTAYTLARKYPNIYLEFSGVPPHLVQQHFLDSGLDLNRIPGKLIFGSDYPALPDGLDGIRNNIESYRKLAAEGLLTRDSLAGLLGSNAERILTYSI